MPDITELERPPARVLPIFYVLDTSGSMKGAPIATLNRAMEETIEALKKLAKSQADAILKVAVLEFNSGCKWMQPAGPEEMEDFIWEDLSAGGLTDVGATLKELNSKLHQSAFLGSMTGAYIPVIIFMSDGCATDDYKKALTEIRENKWFRRATKIGFALGDDPDVGMIADVVGNIEAVVKTEDLELFAKMIKFASVTSSMLCSTSVTTTSVGGEDIVKIMKEQGDVPDTIIGIDPRAYDPEPVLPPDPDPDWGGDWD